LTHDSSVIIGRALRWVDVITTLSGCLSLGDAESIKDASAADANGYDSGIRTLRSTPRPLVLRAPPAVAPERSRWSGLRRRRGRWLETVLAVGVDSRKTIPIAEPVACRVMTARATDLQRGYLRGLRARGWLNCNNDKSDGCGISSANTVQHCGACFAKCSETNATATSCSNGECSHACKTGWGLQRPSPGLTDDG
jgi:hypothetical protein